MLRLLIAIALLPAPAGLTAQGYVGLRTTAIDSVFQAFQSPTGPGCAVGVYREGALTFARGYGALEPGGAPIGPATVFEVMSVSKQFTAAAAALLADDGVLSLDDDIRRFLPELPAYAEPVTIRHLIHHTSGLRNVEVLLSLRGGPEFPIMADVLGLMARQRRPTSAPGTRHEYDNTNYLLLAAIIERASGQSLRAFTSRRIFGPLGMTRTAFRDDPRDTMPDRARGFAPATGGLEPRSLSYKLTGPYALNTSVEDLAKWERQFLAGSLGDGIAELLQTPGKLRDGNATSYAFGLAWEERGGRRWLQHTGAGSGFRATFLRLPGERFAVAVLCNVSTAGSYDLAHRVAQVVSPRYELFVHSDAIGGPPLTPRITPEDLGAFTGIYWDSLAPLVRRVYLENGRLMMASGGQPFELRQNGPGRFAVVPAPQISYRFEGAGAARVMYREAPGEPVARYEWKPAAFPSGAELARYAGRYRSDELDAVWSIEPRDGKLAVLGPGRPLILLEPAFEGVFTGPGTSVWFSRSGGLTLSTQGITFLEFTRVP
jgi:CubicO group peptidase (beta-lactamase class C family)